MFWRSPTSDRGTSFGERLLRRLPELLLGLTALVVMPWLPPALIVRANLRSDNDHCRRNLKAIYQAIQRYRQDHHGEYPTALVGDSHSDPHQHPLVPQYLSLRQILCPLDVRHGEHGFPQPCSYEYQLEELRSDDARVRQLEKVELIRAFGPKFRLVLCYGSHPGNGTRVLYADGHIGQEVFYENDPQVKLRRSFWRIEREDAEHRFAGQRPRAAPAGPSARFR